MNIPLNSVRASVSGEYLKKIVPGRESQVTYTLVKDISDVCHFCYLLLPF